MAAAARTPGDPVKTWTRHDIVAAVRNRGTTLTDLSRGAGLAEGTCRAALSKPMPRANRTIAKFLGLNLAELWPDWYAPDGSRKPLPASEDKRRRPRRHAETRSKP